MPKLTLVVEFVIMALVLMIRPWGLLGKPLTAARLRHQPDTAPQDLSKTQSSLIAAAIVLGVIAISYAGSNDYGLILGVDAMLMVMLAASLHWMMSAAGLHSFGHAAYFGAGAYAAGLLSLKLKWGFFASVLMAPFVAAALAMVFASACIRLSGVYLAMLTLAFSQIIWSVIFSGMLWQAAATAWSGSGPRVCLPSGGILLCWFSSCLSYPFLRSDAHSKAIGPWR
ncbi:MAG: ABC transporter permease, partial [Betaproteobacteria bacterium]|nr:ABC transporter permease [Betaproteobacteria bacterium]